jgi:hypothetical protein
MADQNFANLPALAAHLRGELENKKFVLLYACNGTGKTRLSMDFKDIGKQGEGEDATRDTLYFNAFTEDLFTWDNDLEGDSTRVLKMNAASRFFAGLETLEMETRIRPFLHRYADFDFSIDYSDWTIRFSRDVRQGETTQTIDNIKVSRGEENPPCSSGASFWPLFSLPWMAQKPISGSSTFISMIPSRRWTSTTPLRWAIISRSSCGEKITPSRR